jgi:hypothetical protein
MGGKFVRRLLQGDSAKSANQSPLRDEFPAQASATISTTTKNPPAAPRITCPPGFCASTLARRPDVCRCIIRCPSSIPLCSSCLSLSDHAWCCIVARGARAEAPRLIEFHAVEAKSGKAARQAGARRTGAEAGAPRLQARGAVERHPPGKWPDPGRNPREDGARGATSRARSRCQTP